MKSMILMSLLLAAPALANDVLFDCSLESSNKIGIPENRSSMEISTEDENGYYTMKIKVTGNNGMGRSRVVTKAKLENTGISAPKPIQLEGETTKGETVFVTVGTESRKGGTIGLFAPRYEIVTIVGDEEGETWSCWSPQDPQ